MKLSYEDQITLPEGVYKVIHTGITDRVYHAFWMKLNADWPDGNGWKPGRATNSASNANTTEYWGTGYPVATHPLQTFTYGTGFTGVTNNTGVLWDAPANSWKGNWHHWAIYMQKNTTASSANGILRIWIDGVLKVNRSNMTFWSANTYFYNMFYFPSNTNCRTGHLNECYPGTDWTGMYLYVDNVEIWDDMPTSNTAPEISITSPTCPATVTSSPQTLTVTATDSDGTISSVNWYNDTTSANGSCTGAYSCSVTLGDGENSIRVVATDNGSVSSTVACTITKSVGADYTAPTITIQSPAETNPYYNMAATGAITVSGVAADNVEVSSVTWTCPSCSVTSGTATGKTTWSFSAIPGGGPYGSEVVTTGDFSSSDAWYTETGWEITGGKAVATSASNKGFQQSGLVLAQYANYLLSYDVSGYSGEGSLYLSQYGFGGATVGLTEAAGTYTLEVVCVDPTDPLRFASGSAALNISMDNISLKQKGIRNVVTVTATDSSGNTASDIIYINNFLEQRDVSISAGGPTTLTGGGTKKLIFKRAE
jgi:hypothetical protein